MVLNLHSGALFIKYGKTFEFTVSQRLKKIKIMDRFTYSILTESLFSARQVLKAIKGEEK